MLEEVTSYQIAGEGNLVFQLRFNSGVMIFTPAR